MRFVACALALGCSQPQSARDASADASDEGPPLGGARPLATLRMPDAWDQKTPIPLILVLHGYSVGGLAQLFYLNLGPLVEEKQIMIAAPDGLFDSMGKRYWNAVDTCCDFDHRNNDDVKYLSDLVSEIATRYPIDRKRIYAIGHSNGGAMAMRLACDKTPLFAAIFEIAGPFWSKPQTQCAPSASIALRVLHGTNDDEVAYDGGTPMGSPSALATATFFAQKNGCGVMPAMVAPIHIDQGLTAPETTVSRFSCPAGADVELWTIQGGGHIPFFVSDFRSIVWDFFAAHSR